MHCGVDSLVTWQLAGRDTKPPQTQKDIRSQRKKLIFHRFNQVKNVDTGIQSSLTSFHFSISRWQLRKTI